MKNSKTLRNLLILLIMAGITAYFSACGDNSTQTAQTDDEYINQVLNSGVGSGNQEEGDLMTNESIDINDGGAVSDQDGLDNPIDSLKRWGRRVTGVTVTRTMTNFGDTMKTVTVTRTITGVYIIRGYAGGVMDSVSKPYTEVFNRYVSFKRIDRTPNPYKNWKHYEVSMVNGKTTSPQVGTDQITINKIDVYVGNDPNPKYTFTGPDFSQYKFVTKYFGGDGIPVFNRGDQVRIVVTLNSNQAETDYVAWHWARNGFGFHRIPFVMTSNNGGLRTYEKTFTIYNAHNTGVFNGFISANTRSSMWDDNPSLFSSTTVGTPYRVKY
jgi:hypothetical protein